MAAPAVELNVELRLPMLSDWAIASGVRLTFIFGDSIPTVLVRIHQPAPWGKRSAAKAHSATISRDTLRKSKEETLGPIGIRLADVSDVDSASQELIAQIRQGLEAGKAPEPIADGEGGTYTLFGADGKALAIFKPADEEPHSAGNPKKHGDSPKRDGILPGECARREVAAYKLDRGLAGVPCTVLVDIRHPRWGEAVTTGSVQKWIHDTESGADVGSSSVSADNVHRIGVLDLVTLNTDRHDGNLLVRRGESDDASLIPIDHGFALPSTLGEAYFAWQHWPQAKKPFSPALLEAIAAIDVVHNAEQLRLLGFSALEMRNMRLSTLFLQRAAARGWTLHDIANFVCRAQPETVSPLELLVADAKGQALESGNFWEHFVRLSSEAVSREPSPKSSPLSSRK